MLHLIEMLSHSLEAVLLLVIAVLREAAFAQGIALCLHVCVPVCTFLLQRPLPELWCPSSLPSPPKTVFKLQ